MREHNGGGQTADILLVEDNPGDIRLTQEAFETSQIGNALHVVTDGIEALDFLHQRGAYTDAPRPGIILLDLNLPRQDGEDTLESIKTSSPDLSRIPIIILTSSAAESDVVRSYDLQANAYLTKPIDADEFVRTVERFKDFWLEDVELPPNEEWQS
jgi:CheY-like chemotaxis protein